MDISRNGYSGENVHFSLVGKKKVLERGHGHYACYWKCRWTLPATDADHSSFGNLLIPIGRHGIENQAKISRLTRLNRRRRNRLGIHVGFAGANQAERDRDPLSELAHIIMKADLDGNSGYGPVAAIGDLAVDISDLSPGKASGLAHLDTAEA